MSEWFTEGKVRALGAICALLMAIASWLGWDGFKQRQETEATRGQITTIVNHYYEEGCKPNE